MEHLCIFTQLDSECCYDSSLYAKDTVEQGKPVFSLRLMQEIKSGHKESIWKSVKWV